MPFGCAAVGFEAVVAPRRRHAVDVVRAFAHERPLADALADRRVEHDVDVTDAAPVAVASMKPTPPTPPGRRPPTNFFRSTPMPVNLRCRAMAFLPANQPHPDGRLRRRHAHPRRQAERADRRPGQGRRPIRRPRRRRSLYLGRLDAQHVYAHDKEPDAGMPLMGLYGKVDDERWTIAGRAVQLVEWRRTHRYCGRCASADRAGGAAEPPRHAVPECGLLAFPRLAPAIIVLVTREEDGKALLGSQRELPCRRCIRASPASSSRARRWNKPCIARCAKRSASKCKDVRYWGSQPWPFPHSLMLGFRADLRRRRHRARGRRDRRRAVAQPRRPADDPAGHVDRPQAHRRLGGEPAVIRRQAGTADGCKLSHGNALEGRAARPRQRRRRQQGGVSARRPAFAQRGDPRRRCRARGRALVRLVQRAPEAPESLLGRVGRQPHRPCRRRRACRGRTTRTTARCRASNSTSCRLPPAKGRRRAGAGRDRVRQGAGSPARRLRRQQPRAGRLGLPQGHRRGAQAHRPLQHAEVRRRRPRAARRLGRARRRAGRATTSWFGGTARAPTNTPRRSSTSRT